MKKNNYEAPEAELFVVRFEGNLLQGSPFGNSRNSGNKTEYLYYDDDVDEL